MRASVKVAYDFHMVEEAVRFGCPLPVCGVERRVLQQAHNLFDAEFDCLPPLPICGCVVKVAYRAEDPEEAVQFGCPLPISLKRSYLGKGNTNATEGVTPQPQNE